MNTVSAVFIIVASALLLSLPRRYAVVPLIIGAAWMTRGQLLQLGPASFTAIRILVAVGVVRVLLRGERLGSGLNGVDRLVLLWAVWLIGSSAFHASTSNPWIYRSGVVWTDLGYYFLLRIFLVDSQDVIRMFKVCCVTLLPVAVAMLWETSTQENVFASLGGVYDAYVREGHFRATGPFTHPILAGTVGATCLSMAIYLWRWHRAYAYAGLSASIGMLFACASSGPVLMAAASVLALLLWKARGYMRALRWAAIVGIIALDWVMKDPVYFLMARIDIAGGSKGWFRARLLQSAFEHLDEWWLFGTDYTRHWMASGIGANDQHTDITNHFLAMGVMGGLPLMLIFALVLVAAFRAIGIALQCHKSSAFEQQFLVWTVGALLFGHVVNFFGISLFDQSVVFFYLALASVGAVCARTGAPARAATQTTRRDTRIYGTGFVVSGRRDERVRG